MLNTYVATTEIDAVLVLSNGSFFLGKGIGVKGRTEGEICFNTGLTGYQETITDPSYAGQIITFTFPHIGNVGTNIEDNEASFVACKGIVVREAITAPSNFRSDTPLIPWMEKYNLIGISGIDTRALTRHIRTHGACHAAIVHVAIGEELVINNILDSIRDMPTLLGMELTHRVTTKSPYYWHEHAFELGQNAYRKQSNFQHTIVAIDYGIKHNILRLLVDAGFSVCVMPATASFADIMAVNPEGIFLSNGPGDPYETAKFAVPVIRQLLEHAIPVFGICLGHQLLSLAANLTTKKMHQGHRGANQPVKELSTGRVFITSQNHGFCVTQDVVPETVEITYISLFDQSVEGIRLKNKPAFSVQFHPESSPGPHDTQALFEEFKKMIITHKAAVLCA
ncbi:MAG: carbamoyl-phosphate synthase small subunit [Candidatus Margulisbacteria bacterium]|nr:carbamoyl-phosphate synthase small subunit [Candidatus Margulisiibacteriota bacterium]